MILTSGIANFLYTIVILNSILFELTLISPDIIVSNHNTAMFNNYLNIIANWFIHFMFIWPYIIRAWRLYTIFHFNLSKNPNSQEFNTKRIAEKIKESKQRVNTIIIVGSFVLITLIFCVIYYYTKQPPILNKFKG